MKKETLKRIKIKRVIILIRHPTSKYQYNNKREKQIRNHEYILLQVKDTNNMIKNEYKVPPYLTININLRQDGSLVM